MTLSCRLSIGT